MKSLFNAVLVFLLTTLGAVSAAQAALFHYKFEFDAVTANNVTYGADSFEFDTNALLLNVGDTAPVAPAVDLNGYSVTQIYVNQRNGNAIAFDPDGSFFGSTAGTSAGDVIFYFFCVDNYAGGTGTFGTQNCAGRDISMGDGQGSFYAYTSGRMIISEVNGVPEPGTVVLLAAGLLGLALRRSAR